MTSLLPELEAFPVQGVFNGELMAFSEGQPDFVALYDRTRGGDDSYTFVDGRPVGEQPESRRAPGTKRKLSQQPVSLTGKSNVGTPRQQSRRATDRAPSQLWSRRRRVVRSDYATGLTGSALADGRAAINWSIRSSAPSALRRAAR
jgi:hypothetical protein